MLVGPISSSLFTVASKINRVRARCENVGFVRNCCSDHAINFLLAARLVASKLLQFSPTRFILEPPVGGAAKPLFLLRALPQKNSDFAVLASDDVNLEPVAWHLPGARALCPSGTRASRF